MDAPEKETPRQPGGSQPPAEPQPTYQPPPGGHPPAAGPAPQVKRILPPLDQGWAAVLTGVLALIGTVLTVLLTRPAASPTPTPFVTEPAAVVSPMPSATFEVLPSATSEVLPTETTAPTEAATPSQPQPTVSTADGLPPEQLEALQVGAQAMVMLGGQLPLVMRDDFQTNDYVWPQFNDTFNLGITCEAVRRGGVYSIILTSTPEASDSWCTPMVPRTADNFYVTFDVELANEHTADAMFQYRYVDDSNYYYLLINQQAQRVAMGRYMEAVDTQFINWHYVPQVKRGELNHVALIVQQDSHALFINDTLILMVSGENNLPSGGMRIGLKLYEADQVEELVVDNFELRGD